MTGVEILAASEIAIQAAEFALKLFAPEADHTFVLHATAQHIATLLPSPKEELTGYESARKIAESER